jgi:hypothetical protein
VGEFHGQGTNLLSRERQRKADELRASAGLGAAILLEILEKQKLVCYNFLTVKP